MKTSYKFRMYPNKQQVASLDLTLDTCRYIYNLALADRTHLCPNCGLEMDRDINASLNIRTLGLRGRAYQDPTPTLCKSSKQVRSMT
ncbi:MAG: helix-turn-helix domain-containing protein, partial [Methanothrix sp.]|nr:helix-turn-helix domain-containing protein [Methanothrix sp.]